MKAHARAAAAIPQAATDGCDGCMCESCISRIPCDFALGCHMVHKGACLRGVTVVSEIGVKRGGKIQPNCRDR